MTAPRSLLLRLVPRLDAAAPSDISGEDLNRFVARHADQLAALLAPLAFGLDIFAAGFLKGIDGGRFEQILDRLTPASKQLLASIQTGPEQVSAEGIHYNYKKWPKKTLPIAVPFTESLDPFAFWARERDLVDSSEVVAARVINDRTLLLRRTSWVLFTLVWPPGTFKGF